MCVIGVILFCVFPAFGLNKEKYGVSLHINSEYGKIRTRITPNTDTFYGVLSFNFEIAGAKLISVELYLIIIIPQLSCNWNSSEIIDKYIIVFLFKQKLTSLHRFSMFLKLFDLIIIYCYNRYFSSNLKHANISLLFLRRVIVIDKTCKCTIFLS